MLLEAQPRSIPESLGSCLLSLMVQHRAAWSAAGTGVDKVSPVAVGSDAIVAAWSQVVAQAAANRVCADVLLECTGALHSPYALCIPYDR